MRSPRKTRLAWALADRDVLLFMDGHTVLASDCCAVVDDYFRRHSEAAMAWAPRVNDGETPLGRLVSLHNLRHERLWRALVTQMGHANFGYYSALRANGEDVRTHVRHPVYLVAGRPWTARVFRPLFRAAGASFRALATRALPVSESLASALYVFAVGFTDLSGYCSAYPGSRVI